MGLVFVSSYSILLLDTISFSPSSSSLDEASLPNNTPAPDLYSSGAEGGYSFTKPFVLSNTYNNASQGAAYIGSDGYLYAKGTTWGTSSFTKKSGAAGAEVANAIVDYDIGLSYGITLDTSGVVRVGTATSSASSTVWSTVTVGGVTSGHQAVAISNYYQMVVAKNGAVYVSLDGATTMSSIAISTTVASNNGGVKDIAIGGSYQYVLFNNGSLWGGNDGVAEASMSEIATGVKMFDFDGFSSYIYAYDTSNNMKYATPSGSSTHTWTTLGTEAGVKQIRGGYYNSNAYAGWGYINSSNQAKFYTNGYSDTSANYTVSNVTYIDCGANGTWGYLNTSGQMYLWNSTATSTAITSNTSPGLSASLGSSSVPNLEGGITDISSTPPTVCGVSVQNETYKKEKKEFFKNST